MIVSLKHESNKTNIATCAKQRQTSAQRNNFELIFTEELDSVICFSLFCAMYCNKSLSYRFVIFAMRFASIQ